LMERHGIDDEAVFNLLRDHARTKQAKLVDMGRGGAGHQFLPAKRGTPANGSPIRIGMRAGSSCA
jgi:hypothetical protein